MNRIRLIFLLLLCMIPAVFCPAAGSDGLPNESSSTALFFGEISEELPPNQTLPPDWQEGMLRKFSVLDIASGVMTGCTARVFLVTENAVFWCDQAYSEAVSENVINGLRQFEGEMVPLLRDTFGSEASPGIDNGPRFHVLFTARIGDGYNGYFSAEDSADPRLRPSSNGMELVFLHTRLLERGTYSVNDTLAHEFQHMIHHTYDPNETSFINEGFSGLAEYLAVGAMREPFIRAYLNDTGKSLIWWPDSGDHTAYYGSGFLFSVYLYDRFGPDLIREMVKSPGNALDGLDEAMEALGIPGSADEIFQQWTAALAGQLMRMPVRDLDYSGYAFLQEGITRDIQPLDCGLPVMYEASQYGVRLFRSACGGPFRITVEGTPESPVTGLEIPEGSSARWSGAVSNTLSYLRRDFDLTDADGDILLEYDAVYDIEADYDYYYLLLTDENGSVTRLTPSTASDRDPVGQNRGSGTTGRSGGKVHEQIDLSPWKGQTIRLAFVYLTDTAGVGDGLLLDNIGIRAIGFFDDAETADELWESAGFTRIGRTVPQTFSLTVLHPDGENTAAEFLTFPGGTSVTADCPEGSCVFAVSAVTREVRGRASFTVRTDPL